MRIRWPGCGRWRRERLHGDVAASGSAAVSGPRSRRCRPGRQRRGADARGVGRGRRRERSAEKIAVAIDVRRQIERVLAGEPLRQLGIALLERLDDVQVIDDRAGRAVVLRDRRPAYGAHMDEQIAGRVDDGLRTRRERSPPYGRRCSHPSTRTDAADGGEFWNSSNKCRSVAMSASDACSVASRAAMDSSAAHIWIISIISRLDLRTM